uniref:Uncharacterized protein n=1 Tax=Rhipicephalus zambeziensis TaxID=60191 RepID=A0A224YGL9_9ACAR
MLFSDMKGVCCLIRLCRSNRETLCVEGQPLCNYNSIAVLKMELSAANFWATCPLRISEFKFLGAIVMTNDVQVCKSRRIFKRLWHRATSGLKNSFLKFSRKETCMVRLTNSGNGMGICTAYASSN